MLFGVESGGAGISRAQANYMFWGLLAFTPAACQPIDLLMRLCPR